MAFKPQERVVTRVHEAEIDLGLRAYMLRVYNYMTGGLALTGVVAYLVLTVPALQSMFFTVSTNGKIGMSPLGWVALLAPLGLVFFLSFKVSSIKASTAQALFWGYSALMGIGLSPLLMIYTGASVARVFFITAATFGAMSLYGYVTKRDLSGWGSFLFMGLIGIIIASLVNIFLVSSQMSFIISVIGVLVFTGLTAYDTQKIKESYVTDDDGETMTKKAVMGALTLYLDFINLFIMLLRLIGDRR